MRKILFVAAMGLGLTGLSLTILGLAAARAQMHDPAMHGGHDHGAAAGPQDAREPVGFPAPMRGHMLTNMRDHFEALSEILTAMAAADYEKAASVSRARLGLDAPSAAGCKVDAGPANMSRRKEASTPEDASGMDHMMADHMPERMRGLGLAMHQSASDFAAAAREAARSGDGKPALAALAKVTSACVACHSAYRLQ